MKTLAFIFVLFPFSWVQAQMSFITNGQLINNLYGNDAALGDFNKDGTLDAFVVNMSTKDGIGNRVYLNDGKGIFTDNGQQLIDTAYNNYNAAVGDINRDGKLEVITGSTIWLNNGKGIFKASNRKIDLDGVKCWGVVVQLADLNKDGSLDLFYLFAGLTSSAKIFLNDGSGHFRNTGQTFGGGTMVESALGDIDGDGDIDAVTAGWKSNSMDPANGTNYCPNRIWLNDGKGNFTESDQIIDEGNRHVHDLKMADVNGDGKPDLFLGMTSRPYMRILMNDGTGHFGSEQHFGSIWVSSFDLGDLNNDGAIDVLLVSGDCSVSPTPLPGQVWLNDGSGHFTASKISIGNDISSSVKLGDLNSDKRLDAFVTNWGWDGTNQVGRPAKIWLNLPYSCNYLNETHPGNTPLLFGSGTVSVKNENTHSVSFYPDGKSLFFSRYPERKSYSMSCTKDVWSNPVEAFYDGKETSISSNGDQLYYYKNGGDIFGRTKSVNGWSEEWSVGTAINTKDVEYYPSITNDGTLFFSRNGNWAQGRIQYSSLTNGQYSSPVDIGLPVNVGGALHAYISPDKSYMLFNSPRKGSFTQLDIWISYNKQNRGWTNPKNLGQIINTGADAILCPTVTPDGKYLFYTRLTFSNSTGNVFWVSTNFVDSLRRTNYIPYLKTSLADQVGTTGQSFSFTVPRNTFVDDDGNNTLTYEATLPDGKPLPTWLQFDASSQKFSGTPSTAEVVNIRVTASDTAKTSITDDFKITINTPI
jgi:hypothetical protein